MNKSTKWILGAAAALALSGLVYAGSAVAANQMHGMHGMMMGKMGGMHAKHHGAMAPMMAEMPAMHEQVMGEVAALLGMDAADLEGALQEGTTLKDLAMEHGVDPEAVRTLMVEQMQAFVDQMVSDGRLTAEQAEQMTAMMAEHAELCLTGQMAGMMGPMHGKSMMKSMHGKGMMAHCPMRGQ